MYLQTWVEENQIMRSIADILIISYYTVSIWTRNTEMNKEASLEVV